MQKKNQKKKKKNSFTKKERYIISLSLFLILFFIILTYFIVFVDYLNHEIEEEIAVVEEEIKEELDSNLAERFIDGVLVDDTLANSYPVALILDNDPKNRYPQGIDMASLVYELATEGGTSRFLAIFASDLEIDRVGPIRSARPYFIDLADDSSALLVHCGGSPQALAQLSQERINNLNEFYYANYFWRDKNYSAPNNIFINSSSWQKFLDNQGLRQVNRASWKFIQEEESLLVPNSYEHESILVNYSKNYQRTWHYNEDLNLYEIKGDNSNIQAKNLVFHYTNSRVLDEILRLEINLLGENEAVICQLGTCKEGMWRKSSKSERLRYYDENGEELNFIAGNTWISIISAGAYINY